MTTISAELIDFSEIKLNYFKLKPIHEKVNRMSKTTAATSSLNKISLHYERKIEE